MFRLPLVFSALIGLSASVLRADPIPYSNPGTLAAASALTATSTGDVTGYFAGQSSAHNSVVRLVDLTSGYVSAYFFTNHSTIDGTSANFGSVNAGDTLIFELYNQTLGLTFATDPSHSVDGLNHGYEANFAGGFLNGVVLPSGVYIGMEDLPGGGDLDYNDNTFLFTNVSIARATTTAAATAPEPGSLVLLGTGVLGAAGALRRKLATR